MKKPTVGFWIVAGLFLLWNAFGCTLYVLDVSMTDTQYAQAYGEAMAAARGDYPSWATFFYALAVWGGLLGALTLLLRRSIAIGLFILSLVAAVICFVPNFTMPSLKAAGGPTFWVMPLIVVVIGLVEVWYSRRARAKGLLR